MKKISRLLSHYKSIHNWWKNAKVIVNSVEYECGWTISRDDTHKEFTILFDADVFGSLDIEIVINLVAIQG